ncbi:hypothetical protein [Bacillus sp. EAC]|uniref:hypothetical protein n=1 Tax=Bacillus sp. EAC TaxID=1978338 RepID=UPI0015C4EA73|nr:hypothetical protein [Bacillus sp. EAC]
MTIIGYLFWGICFVAVIFAFFMEKKFGTTAPHKTEHQVLHEELTRISHNNDRPRL